VAAGVADGLLAFGVSPAGAVGDQLAVVADPVPLRFSQGFGRETRRARSVHTSETRVYRLSCRLPGCLRGSERLIRTAGSPASQTAGISSEKSKGSRRPVPMPTVHGDRDRTEPPALKSLQMARFISGRPDLNRGPHRPELWAKSAAAVESTWKSMGSGLGSPPLRTSDIAADSRGFGRETDSLPNDEDADTDSVGCISSPRCAATARAPLQVPNRRVTTLAVGHPPCARRANASPPRRRACVRDQSYDVGNLP
jgi:hypothetical protein